MAVPAKTIFATGAAFVVGAGLTVGLVPRATTPSPGAPVAAAAPNATAPSPTAASAPPAPRAWVDPVRPAPVQLAETTPVDASPKPADNAVVTAVPETPAVPKKVAAVRKRQAKSVASARLARIRMAKAHPPRDAYADAGFADERVGPYGVPASSYGDGYRQASATYRGPVYADASGPYAEPRAVRAAPEGGVLHWLMEPGVRR